MWVASSLNSRSFKRFLVKSINLNLFKLFFDMFMALVEAEKRGWQTSSVLYMRKDSESICPLQVYEFSETAMLIFANSFTLQLEQ